MFVNCPHCDVMIEVVELNCCIFRCGVHRITGVQIPPHSSKEECDRLLKFGELYGCGKPFQIIKTVSGVLVVECEYI